MKKATRHVLGFDVGDKRSTIALLDAETGELRNPPSVGTDRKSVEKLFRGLPRRTRVVLETGTHSGWIAALGRRLGLEVVVADARRLDAVTKNVRKSDVKDAELLARMGASSMDLLCPVWVRDRATQADLSVVRMRDAAVAARTLLVNAARGTAKSLGERLPSGSTEAFAKRAAADLPPHLAAAVEPALAAVAAVTEAIRAYDAEIERLCAKHAATARLRAVAGVGPVTSLCFALTVGDPARFDDPRDVAAYVGLVPRRSQSGATDRQLRISKCGDALLRRLLVQCAHRILGPFGKDGDLRTWGMGLAAKGGRNGKKRAVVAVARKLAVLLLVLWKKQSVYEPVRTSAA